MNPPSDSIQIAELEKLMATYRGLEYVCNEKGVTFRHLAWPGWSLNLPDGFREDTDAPDAVRAAGACLVDLRQQLETEATRQKALR